MTVMPAALVVLLWCFDSTTYVSATLNDTVYVPETHEGKPVVAPLMQQCKTQGSNTAMVRILNHIFISLH